MKTLAVVGSRNFNNYELLKTILDKIQETVGFDKIVSGGAKGADKLAERYAEERNIDIDVIYPMWDKYGKSAGFIRNKQIWDKCDFGVAFWDGKSKGTKHSFEIAKKQNKECIIVNYTVGEIYFLNKKV